jgi:hypothetical protein
MGCGKSGGDMCITWRNALLPAILGMLLVTQTRAQDARDTLLVKVQDSSGAVIPGAIVQISGPGVDTPPVKADAAGQVSAKLPPGTYSIHVSWNGFAEFATSAEVKGAGTTVIEAVLDVNASADSVTVASDTSELSTEPAENASAVVLKGEDLDSLPEDASDLTADLKGLTGSPDPEILVDGFSGGRVPPKSAIREIRINQNPFSAEYDRMGLGRAEILTKPGSEQYHGSAFFKFSDGLLNSRNPYLPEKAPYQSRQFGGDFGGPAGRTRSLFLQFERVQIDDNAVVNATALDSQLRIVPVETAIPSPQSTSSLNARFDQQLGTRNTASARFTWLETDTQNAGIGGLVLPSRAYRTLDNSYTAQSTLTSVLSNHATNELRFQYTRDSVASNSASNTPSLLVLDSFAGGGPLNVLSFSGRDHIEVHNITSWSLGRHTLKFGGRVRDLSILDESRKNFNGQFVFSGDAQLSSIERYQRTLLLMSQGLTPSAIRNLGGGPSQFMLAAGQPQTSLGLVDAGLFVQDDWRISPAFSLSAGLRWEAQSRVGDRADFAPRLGFAWAPGPGKQRNTVIRGGFGIFFQRVGEDVLLNAARFDGTTQALYVVRNPDFFPNIPPPSDLAAMALPPTVRRLQPGLQDAYLYQGALSIERRLPFGLVVSTTYTNTRGLHLLMSRNTTVPGTGHTVFTYESSGILNQNQLLTSVARRFSGHFSLFGYYALGHAYSNTDGPDSMPADQLNARADYGRSALDMRHRTVIGGSIVAPFGIRISPFLMARSGAPFNITTGQDANGDLVFNDRPSFALTTKGPGVVATPWGLFDVNPAAGMPVIPHNYGQGPAFCTLNVRISRDFGFGIRESHVAGSGGKRDGSGMTPASDDSVLKNVLRDGPTEHRFNLTVAVQVRNALNHLNAGLPLGNLSSPMFGRSNWLASSAGADSPAMGDNRRIQLLLRLTF